jgi:transposase
MANSTNEIIDGKERRRRWGLTEKLRIVAESHEPGATVRSVSARHDVYPSLVRTWRRQVREGRLAASPPGRFVPVRADPVSVPAPVVSEQAAAGAIEIVLPDGLRLRAGNDVGLAALRRVLTVLRG